MSLTGTFAGQNLREATVCGVGPFGPDSSANIGDQTTVGTVVYGANSSSDSNPPLFDSSVLLKNYTFADPLKAETFKVCDGAAVTTRFDEWHLFLVMAGKVEIDGSVVCDGIAGSISLDKDGGGGDGGIGNRGGGGGGGSFKFGGSGNGGNGSSSGTGTNAGAAGTSTFMSWFDSNSLSNFIFGTAGSGGNGSDNGANSDPDEGIGSPGASYLSGGGGGGAGVVQGTIISGSSGGGGGGGVIGFVCDEFTMGSNGLISAKGGDAGNLQQQNYGGGGGGGCVSIWTRKYDGSANGKIDVSGGVTNSSRDGTDGTAGTIQIFELNNDCTVITARTLTDTWNNL